jgi:Tfp pilus assembly protein PilW
MSLIEVAVSMFVASILFTAVGTVFLGVLRGVSTTNVKTSTGADGRLAIEAMSRTLSVAITPTGQPSAFVSASTTGVTFYSLLNRTGTNSVTEPRPTMVAYTYNSTTSCLNEALTPGVLVGTVYSWPASGTRTKCLLRTATAPTFAYFTSSSLAATALSAGSGLSAANLLTVRRVDLRVVATDPANRSIAGVPLDTRIVLANLTP